MPLTLCPACKKMLYRQDACRGSGACGRTDGGSKSTGSGAPRAERGQKPKAKKQRKSEQPAQAGSIDSEPRKTQLVERVQTVLVPTGESVQVRERLVLRQEDFETNIFPPPPKRGRPRIHPDRRAYKADWEKGRRAKLKAEREKK